jgi:3',5'-cyclic AMP phosphodiesterase CpdA
MVLADPQFGLMAHYSGKTAEEAAAIRARGMPAEAGPKFESWEQEEKLFAAAIAEANRLRPHFVVVCGDMVMQWDNRAQVDSVRRVAAKLDPSIPLHWVAGNHDIGIDFYTPTPESLAAYRATYGKDYFSFQHGSTLFVVINSPLLDRPGGVPGELDAQMAWLRKTLYSSQIAGAERTIVFSHHPPFLKYPEEEDNILNLPIERRRRLIDLLLFTGVKAVFAGHTHMNVVTRYGGMDVIASGAVGLNRIGHQSGYRVVRVSPEGISHDFHTLPVDR